MKIKAVLRQLWIIFVFWLIVQGAGVQLARVEGRYHLAERFFDWLAR